MVSRAVPACSSVGVFAPISQHSCETSIVTTKKFLSAEEVVDQYGVDEAVLSDLVKDGSLKALADRGTWKFRRDDIDALVRAKMLHPTKELPTVGEEAVSDVLSFADEGTGSSAIDFIELDEDALAEQPTMITGGKDASQLPKFDFTDDNDDSSSEVNVVLEPMETDFSDSDIRLAQPPRSSDKVTGDTSDSDVKTLSSLSAPLAADNSDSDVKTLSGREAAVTGNTSDSDVKTLSSFNMAAPAVGSDSDVKSLSSTDLAASAVGSDSDVKTLSSFEMAAADSGISLDSGHTQEIELEEDDGISLPPRNTEVTMEIPATSDSTFDLSSDSALELDGSSIKSGDSSMLIDDPGSSVLDEPDSGISLDAGDSGISLDTGDSGISLDTGDSGISLDAGDSGITLDAGDSGITLSADSGISVQDPIDKPKRFDKTEAMFDIPEDDFDLAPAATSHSATPSEELEATAAFQLEDDSAATMPTLLGTDDDDEPKPKKRDPLGFSGAIAAGATIENLEIVDDLDNMVAQTDVEADAIFEDEEAEVLEASDESFAEFDEAPADDGMLSEEFEAPVMAAKKEPKDRGFGPFATFSIIASSLVLALNGWILWEGIATMWNGAAPSGPAASIISSLAGLF